MNTLEIDLSTEIHSRLEAQARREGKTVRELTRELIESALRNCEESRLKTTREVLESLGRVHTLSESLRRKIIPGVTIDEVQAALTDAAGPPLSEIIMEQRGPKT